MRLHGAMLFVKNLNRVATFYTSVLGLHPIEATRLDNWVEFSGEGSRFALHAIPREFARSIRIASPPRPREQAATKLTFDVLDVEGTLAKIEAAGLPLLRRPWGGIEAMDPEGNVFALRAAG